jgi:hypothetical protein
LIEIGPLVSREVLFLIFSVFLFLLLYSFAPGYCPLLEHFDFPLSRYDIYASLVKIDPVDLKKTSICKSLTDGQRAIGKLISGEMFDLLIE